MGDQLGRRTSRHRYWEAKYADTQWAEDIHIPLLSDVGSKAEFERGIRLNTEQVCNELCDGGSVYGMTKGAKVLDYACGAGDLLLRLAERFPHVSGVGIDTAEMAVLRARERAPAAVKDRVHYVTGELEALAGIVAAGDRFDLIVFRDAYYLLDREEQQELWQLFRAAARPGAVACVADLTVEAGHEGKLAGPLIERQSGGEPITWRWNGTQRAFSVIEDAERAGFRLVAAPSVKESAVEMSYLSAAQWAVGGTQEAFKALGKVAGEPSGNGQRMPYVRFVFGVANGGPPKREEFGFELREGIGFGGRGVVLRPGRWCLPLNQWSLVVGRSGAGKSTFLDVLARRRALGGKGVLSGKQPLSWFLLSQHTELITDLSVDENMNLFAREWSQIDNAAALLGFDEALRRRAADVRLSGGERQRVALGQAIASGVELLLLDEPTTGVDAVRRYEFFQTLHSSDNRAATVVCVDHQFLDIEMFFDYVFEIVNGNLICVKSPPAAC